MIFRNLKTRKIIMSTERKPWRNWEGKIEKPKEQLLYEIELEKAKQERKPCRVREGWFEPVEGKPWREPIRREYPDLIIHTDPYKQLLYEVELERRAQVMKEKERERDIMWWEMQPDNKAWIEIVG